MLIKKLLFSPMHTDNKHTNKYPFVFCFFYIRNPTSPLLVVSGLGGEASSTGTWDPGPLVRQLGRDWGTGKITSEKSVGNDTERCRAGGRMTGDASKSQGGCCIQASDAGCQTGHRVGHSCAIHKMDRSSCGL